LLIEREIGETPPIADADDNEFDPPTPPFLFTMFTVWFAKRFTGGPPSTPILTKPGFFIYLLNFPGRQSDFAHIIYGGEMFLSG
jgi:hypothetical protein